MQTLRLPVIASVLCSILLASDLAVGDAYYSVPFSELEVGQPALEPPANEAGGIGLDWRLRPFLRPRVAIDGPGEAYVDIEWSTWNPSYAGAKLCVRAPEAREVRGRLWVPKGDWSGLEARRFTIPASQANDAARSDFLRALDMTCRTVRGMDVPGAAWFRHRAREARRELGQEPDAPANDGTARGADRETDLEATFAIFTGGRAISENLQLDRVLPVAAASDETVEMSAIDGISVAEIDWKPLVAGLEPKLDPLAANIPADQHALFFPTFGDLVSIVDEATRQGTPILRFLETRGEDARTRERYERQLCLSLDGLTRLLGPRVISSVAATGSDPYLRTGSDLAVLFEASEPAMLRAHVEARQASALKAAPGAREVSGEIDGVAYRGVVTDDRSVSSYAAGLDRVVVVSNSLKQLAGIVHASRGKAPALAGLPEYAFFRDRYRLGDDGETAFLVLSDATIRRWCGPRWRIGASRRTLAAAVLSDLQAAHAEDIATGRATPAPLQVAYGLPGGGELRLESAGVRSSAYGTLSFLTPIAELGLERATKAEADAYRRWREGYQRNWRQVFDPIAVRLSLRGGRLAADVSVLPLIAATRYAETIDIVGGARIAPDAGDPHPEALVHFIMAVDRDSDTIRRAGNFVLSMAPGLGANALGWLGRSLAVYADEDPFWTDLAKADDVESFMERSWARLPLALRIEVANPLTAAAFLASVRAFVEQTAPGMTRWEALSHAGRPFVKISPTASAGLPPELQAMAVWYASGPDAITLTLSEPVLKRALERQGPPAGGPREGDAARPWLGESYCLRADSRFSAALEALSRDQYAVAVRRGSWASLPILNEWKRLFPSEDPVLVHERLWGVRLVCPAGGRYVWNAEDETMESTATGHPGAPKVARIPWPLDGLSRGDFGLTFERVGAAARGLRARAVLERSDPPGVK